MHPVCFAIMYLSPFASLTPYMGVLALAVLVITKKTSSDTLEPTTTLHIRTLVFIN